MQNPIKGMTPGLKEYPEGKKGRKVKQATKKDSNEEQLRLL